MATDHPLRSISSLRPSTRYPCPGRALISIHRALNDLHCALNDLHCALSDLHRALNYALLCCGLIDHHDVLVNSGDNSVHQQTRLMPVLSLKVPNSTTMHKMLVHASDDLTQRQKLFI